MNNRRLWPVASVLVTLVSGSLSVEVLARVRNPSLERIEITTTQTAVEEDESDTSDLQFGSTITPEHARARELARRGELADSVERFAELVAQHPEQALLRAEAAHVLLRSSRLEDALPLLEASARLLPDNPAVLLDLGVCQSGLGKTREALATLSEGLRRRPNHGRLRLELGEMLRRQRRLAEAVTVLEPAARQGSNDERSRALASLGRCYVAQGQEAQARLVFEEAVQRAPASVNTWVRVARGLLHSEQRSDQEQALQYATRAARLAPELPLIHSLLGRIHEKLGHLPEASGAYREAVRLDRDYLYPRRRLLRLGLDAEDFRLARQQADALLRAKPELAEHHFLAGLVAARSGELETARKHYETAIEKAAGKYPEAFYNLGILERQANHPARAIAAYQLAIEQRPDFRAAYTNLGLVHLEGGAFAEADAAFHKALELDPKNVAAWTNLARSALAQQKPDAALAAYERALALAPPTQSLRMDYALALQQARQPDQAIAVYRKLVSDDPRFQNGWYNLGIALEAAGQVAEARFSFERVLELDPEHLRALKRLAQLEARSGLRAPARAHLTDALDRDPADRELRLTLAQLMWSEQDFAGCSHAAQLVLAQAPDQREAQTLLGNCSRQ